MFANRTSAGKQLAEKLYAYLSDHPTLHQRSNMVVVVGLPRGGVPVALEVARKFGCQLEVIVAKKLPFPGEPEYAIGAVSSDGVVVLSPDVPHDFKWKAYIEQQRQTLLERTRSIERNFYALAKREQTSLEDKTVILVDDGIATGMTAMAALGTASRLGAGRLVIAAPIISQQSYQLLRPVCDDVVALTVPTDLHSVGQHYMDFNQTSEAEAVRALRESTSFATPPQAHTTALRGASDSRGAAQKEST